jgi:hypothetical protein
MNKYNLRDDFFCFMTLGSAEAFFLVKIAISFIFISIER